MSVYSLSQMSTCKTDMMLTSSYFQMLPRSIIQYSPPRWPSGEDCGSTNESQDFLDMLCQYAKICEEICAKALLARQRVDDVQAVTDDALRLIARLDTWYKSVPTSLQLHQPSIAGVSIARNSALTLFFRYHETILAIPFMLGISTTKVSAPVEVSIKNILASTHKIENVLYDK